MQVVLVIAEIIREINRLRPWQRGKRPHHRLALHGEIPKPTRWGELGRELDEGPGLLWWHPCVSSSLLGPPRGLSGTRVILGAPRAKRAAPWAGSWCQRNQKPWRRPVGMAPGSRVGLWTCTVSCSW